MKLKTPTPEKKPGPQPRRGLSWRPWLFLCLGLAWAATTPVMAATINPGQVTGRLAWQEGRPCLGPVSCLADMPHSLKGLRSLLGGDLEGDDEEDGDKEVFGLQW